jgi:hypothetical protein
MEQVEQEDDDAVVLPFTERLLQCAEWKLGVQSSPRCVRRRAGPDWMRPISR